MITKEVLENMLANFKSLAKSNGKNLDALQLRRENGSYCLTYSLGGGYREFSPWMSAKEMQIFFWGLSKGIDIKF